MCTKTNHQIKIENAKKHLIVTKMNEMVSILLHMETTVFQEISQMMHSHGLDLFDNDKDAMFMQCRHLRLITEIGRKYTQKVWTILHDNTLRPVDHITEQEKSEEHPNDPMTIDQHSPLPQQHMKVLEANSDNQPTHEPIMSPAKDTNNQNNNKKNRKRKRSEMDSNSSLIESIYESPPNKKHKRDSRKTTHDIAKYISPAPVHWKVMNCTNDGDNDSGRFRLKLKAVRHPIKEAITRIGGKTFGLNELLDTLAEVEQNCDIQRSSVAKQRLKEELCQLRGCYNTCSGKWKHYDFENNAQHTNDESCGGLKGLILTQRIEMYWNGALNGEIDYDTANKIKECRLCGRTRAKGWSISVWVKHLNNKHIHKCDRCPFGTTRSTYLKDHLALQHNVGLIV